MGVKHGARRFKPAFTDSVKLSIKIVEETSTAKLKLELPEQLSYAGEIFRRPKHKNHSRPQDGNDILMSTRYC
jgi:hypothetical protein